MRSGAPLARLDHPGLVPASLLPPEDPAGRLRRTVRDWLVDCALFAIAVLLGLVVLNEVIQGAVHTLPDGKLAVDLLLGAVACLSLWGRRRWPVEVTALTIVISAFSAFGSVASLVAIFTVAVHRRTVTVLPLAVGALVAAGVQTWWEPQEDTLLTALLIGVVAVAIVVAWGMVVRARRQLVWSLRKRAERAEDEQRMLAEQARTAERARIAREMHDVLAHRISLLALHAGALEVRPDLPGEQVRSTASLLRTTARQALEELRDVIGVLREEAAPGDAAAPRQPQPTVDDVHRLVEERRRAGAKIDYEIAADGKVPGGLGRDAYRIVQEALTNVAKHAHGTATSVRVGGAPGGELTVRVSNLLPVDGAGPTLPGSGTGLIGLAERVSLAGGTLTHGPRDGSFVVEARLPWR